MRWRLIVLGLLAVALGVLVGICVHGSAELSYLGQKVFTESTPQPTVAQQEAATRAFQQSAVLQVLILPLAMGSLSCALAIPAILATRWNLRESRMNGL